MVRKNLLVSFLAIICSFILVGCIGNATGGEISKSKEEKLQLVEEIIKEYYELVFDENYVKSYEYLSTGTRNRYSFERYNEYKNVQGLNSRMIEYEVRDILLSEDYILVLMRTKRIDLQDRIEDSNESLYITREGEDYKIDLRETFSVITSFCYNNIIFGLLKKGKETDIVVVKALYEKAIEVYPNNHQAYILLISAYTVTGNIDLAFDAIDLYIKEYQKMEEDIQSLAEAYEHKGINLLGKGKIKEAIEAYTKSLELNPDNEYLKETILRLEVY